MGNKAQAFAALHVKGAPLVLYNCWDAGSAQAIAQGGAPALAMGSWSVAAAQGYDDGERLPMAQLLALVERIAQAQDVPLSVDFEGTYGDAPEIVAANARLLVQTGASGFFVPGLCDATLIRQVCAQVSLPVNVMMRPELAAGDALARAGVARISYGPASYRSAMAEVTESAAEIYSPV